MNIKERSNGTEGTIQTFGHGHLTTSDRTVAQAGSSDAYVGDGRIQGNPSETGSVEQSAPALKAEKSATTPVTARPTKSEGFTGFSKAAGVASHPGLMRAHQTGSVSDRDHKVVHGRGSEPKVVMSKPEAAGSTMPTVAKLSHGYADLGKDISTGGPVVARPNPGPNIGMRSR
jgi:hypothetical protein